MQEDVQSVQMDIKMDTLMDTPCPSDPLGSLILRGMDTLDIEKWTYAAHP